jgi:hypothetical protein
MATLYFRSTGANWGTAGDWSTTPSPVYTGGSVPTAADDVIFEAASANCIVNTSNRVCKSITFATYTNTIQMTFNITVSGNITFGASMNVSGSGILVMNASGTLTSNGYVWSNEFRFNGTSQTYTIASDMTFGGVLSTTGAVTLVTLAGARTITCNSGVTAPVFLGGVGTTIRIAGGTTSGSFSTCDLVLYSGTITLGNIGKNGASFIYTAGTVNATGGSLTLSGTVSVSLGSNVVFGSGGFGGTMTFNDDVWIAGTLFTNGGNFLTPISKRIYCWGISGSSAVNDPFTHGAIKPTIVLNGTGAWAFSGGFGLNLTIDTLGTINFTSTATLGSTFTDMTATYVKGTITTALTYIFSAIRTFIDMGITTLPAGISSAPSGGGFFVTLLSDLNIAGTLRIGGTSTNPYNGAFNVNVGGGLLLDGSAAISGTATIRLIGTGTWSMPLNPAFNQSLEINTSGSITLSGTVNHTGNFLYTNGTIISTGSTLRKASNMTINASGFNLGTLNLTGTCQFLGTNGFTMANLNCVTATVVSRWTPTNEYIITNSILSGQADGISKITYTSSNNAVVAASFATSIMTVTSVVYGTISVGDTVFGEGIAAGVTVASFGTGSGGIGTYVLSASIGTLSVRTIITSPNTASYPKITLNNGATQSIYYTNAIDVDSNNGQTIWSFGSTLLRAFNWNVGSRPNGFSFTWVR